jgi:non-specific serine/threonine protein kinase
LSATAWRVPSLSLPALPEDAAPTPTDLMDSEAVQLFVVRASAAQPGFALTSHNAPAIAQICRRLDGVPLALERAATRVATLSPQQIAARLTDRFALLTDGNRTALPRHQTLRALVDWSYELLTPAEQELFQIVGVFVGGWALEAAEQVSDRPDTLNLLSSLVAKSLVVADAQDTAVRYHMLETIAAYARERLAQHGAAEAAQRRHLAWSLALASAADYAHPDAHQPPWHRRLAAEHDNLRAALAWAMLANPAAALELVARLWYFWFWGGFWSEGAAWAKQALAHTSEPNVIRATVLIGASNLAGRAGDYGTAARWLAEGSQLAGTLRDPEAMAWARISQSVHAADPPTAEALLTEAVELARACGSRWLEADAQCLQGDRARGQHDFDRAERRYAASRRLFEELGSAEMCPWPIGNLGRLVAERGDHARAALIFAECVARCRASGNNVGMVDWLLQLARAALASGDRDGARRAVAEGLPIAHAIGNAEAQIDWFAIGADLVAAQEQYMQAAALLGAADALLERHHLLHRGADLAAGTAYKQTVERLRHSMQPAAFERGLAAGRARALSDVVAELSAIVARA